MRLFIAALVPAALIGSLQETRRILTPRWPHARWSDPAGAHLTLKFLGETPDDRRAAVERVLEDLATGLEAFEVEIAGLGAFPAARRPQVLWAGVRRGGEILADRAARIESALAEAGFPREARAFHPHVTLARVKPGRSAEAPWPPELSDKFFGAFTVAAVSLMRSESKSGGSLYSVVREFPLKPGSRA